MTRFFSAAAFAYAIALLASLAFVSSAEAVQALTPATFVERIDARPSNLGQVVGMDDSAAETITFDDTVTANGNFISRYISEARTSGIGVPTADVQGDGINVLAHSLARVTFEVAIAPPAPGVPTTVRIPTLVRYQANLVAAVGNSNSQAFAEARIATSGGINPINRMFQVHCVTGGDCSTQNVTGVLPIFLVPGGSGVSITKEAKGAITGVLFLAGTGSFQAVVDPVVEIDPNHMVNIPGQGLVRSADVYDLIFSSGISIPEPRTIVLLTMALLGLYRRRERLVGVRSVSRDPGGHRFGPRPGGGRGERARAGTPGMPAR